MRIRYLSVSHNFWANVLLFFVFILAFSHGVGNTITQPGKYTLLFPKNKLNALDKSQFHSLLNDRDVFEEEFVIKEKKVNLQPLQENGIGLEPIEMHGILEKLLNVSQRLHFHNSKIMLQKGILVSSVKAWPMGWKHYPMILSHPSKNTLVATSSGRKQSGRKLKVIARVALVNNQSMTINTVVKASRLPKKDVVEVGESIARLFEQELKEKYKISVVRKLHLKKYSELSSLSEKEKKKLKLDKIINPDKYKSKSPTVRSPGSKGCGNGRYNPSAETQARRQVRKS